MTNYTNRSAANLTFSSDLTENLQIPLHETVLHVTYSIVLLLASASVNTLIVAMFAKKSELLSNASNKLVFNFTVFSFICTWIVLPGTLVTIITKDWILGSFLCQATGFLTVSLSASTLLNLTSFTIDRYHYIINPLTYPMNMTPFKVNVILFFIWFAGIMTGLMPLFGWNFYKYDSSRLTCTVEWSLGEGFYIYFTIISYFIPLVVQIYCYGCIINAAKKHAHFGRRMSRIAVMPVEVKTIIRETSANRTIKKTIIMLGTFFVTWTPCTVVILIQGTLKMNNMPRMLNSITFSLSFLLYLIYPILFVFRASHLKKEMRRFLLEFSILRRFSNRVGIFSEELNRMAAFPNHTESRRSGSIGTVSEFDFSFRRRSSHRGSRVSFNLPPVVMDGIEPAREARPSLTQSTTSTDLGTQLGLQPKMLLPGEVDDDLETGKKSKTRLVKVR